MEKKRSKPLEQWLTEFLGSRTSPSRLTGGACIGFRSCTRAMTHADPRPGPRHLIMLVVQSHQKYHQSLSISTAANALKV
jgi:hypothetical protein